MKLAGRIHHDNVFFRDDGSQIRNLNDPYDNWRASVERLKIRYREPKNARQSCVSWYLMIGKNVLWVSKNHGHSVQTMLSSYAAWTEGAKESDIAAIRQAMDARPPALQRAIALRANSGPPGSPEFATNMPPTPPRFKLRP